MKTTNRVAAWIALSVALAMIVLFLGGDSASAVAFEPCAQTGPASTEPNVPADIQTIFGTGIGPDCKIRTADDNFKQSNFGAVISFTPTEWGVYKDSDGLVPIGTEVGSLSSRARLGLLNNPCTIELGVDFTLVNATTKTTDVIDALPPGSKDRLSPLAVMDGGVMAGAKKWPSYLTTQFVERNGADLSKLRARLFGVNTTAVTGLTVVLNFMIFEPGSRVSDEVNLDPRLGYPSVTVLNDPTATASDEDPLSDFCAPLATKTITLGTAGGVTYRKNPGAGTYNFLTFSASQPDAENDGIENSLDPCPYTDDSNWDPRGANTQNPGDRDGDGIPDSCDPFPDAPSTHSAGTGIARADEDGDGWQNRGDNCSIVSNADQLDDDNDGIGNACDQNLTARDGEIIKKCSVSTVTIGSGGGSPIDPSTVQPCDPNAPLFNASGATTPTPVGQTPGPGATRTPVGQTPGPGGIGGPPAGFGSLSPTGTELPLWAAILAAAGAIGILSGLALFTRSSPRHGRR